MKKITLTLLALTIVISSCNNFSANIAKRKYRKGYSVNVSFKKKAVQLSALACSQEKNDTPVSLAPALISYLFLNSENKLQLAIPEKAEKANHASTSKRNSETKPVTGSAEKKSSVVKKSAGEKAQEKRNGDKFFLLFSGLISAISMTVLRLKVNSAKKISRWAKNNRKKTWLAFVALRALTIPGALLSGMLLYANNFIVTPFATGVLATVFIASTLLYPRRNAQGCLPYLRHKMTDLVIALSGFMLLAGLGNTMVAVPESRPAQLYASIAGVFTKDSEKTKPQFIYEKIIPKKKSVHDEDVGNAIAKFFLLLLAIALLIGLEMLIASISCNLSCSGQDALAAFVAIAGTALNIWLFIVLIRAIFPKPATATKN